MKTLAAVCILIGLGMACKEKKQKHLAAARGNSVKYALARCTCEKEQKKTPPGDLTRCTEDMALAMRYLNLNLEFGSFSTADKQEIEKAGDDAYKKCMGQVSP